MGGARSARIATVRGKSFFGEAEMRLRHRKLCGSLRYAIPKPLQITDLVGLREPFEADRFPELSTPGSPRPFALSRGHGSTLRSRPPPRQCVHDDTDAALAPCVLHPNTKPSALSYARHGHPAPHPPRLAPRPGVRLVRFLYTDNGGITRGKATHVDGLAHRLTDGIGLTVAMQAMNMLHHLQPAEGLAPVGEIRLVPDPQTYTVLPYAPHAAAMTSDMRTLDGAPWGECPREFLQRQIAAR